MEKLFHNLYRTGTSANKRGFSHSYLLVRKEGNLLICHQQGPSAATSGRSRSSVESKACGSATATTHSAIYNTTSCTSSSAASSTSTRRHDRPARKRAKCPFETFGDEGIQYADDFEGFNYPACTSGHAVYRWKSRGKYFLFTAHSMYANDKGWDTWFKPNKGVTLHKAHIDYVFPGYTPESGPDFYRLDDKMRRSLSRRINELIKRAA